MFEMAATLLCPPDLAVPLFSPLPGPQTNAYESDADIIGYGGSAGGGKTLLAVGKAATRHKKSIIFRRHKEDTKDLWSKMRTLYGTVGRANESSKEWKDLPGDRYVRLVGLQHLWDWQNYQGQEHDFWDFDEATQFPEIAIRTLMAWCRSPDPNQRCQVMLGFNPPTTPEGEWIIDFFGPWLDEAHPNPALPGELRWFARLDDKDVEVKDGAPFEHKSERVKPLSRTFFPARLEDNPILDATNYRATLQGLPEPLRSQMLYGDFSIGLQDDEWQVIPTAWVRAAQARWSKGARPSGPMTQAGIDVAQGGADAFATARRWGTWFDEIEIIPGPEVPDANVAAQHVARVLADGGIALIDGDGIGSSTFFLAHALIGDRVGCYMGSAPTDWRDRPGGMKFLNTRAAAYWALRLALDPSSNLNVALPPDRDLLVELTAPTWKPLAHGAQLEPKADIKARLGRSPDCLVAGTKILTPSGERHIEDIRIGDSVTTPWGVSRVGWVHAVETDDIVTVCLVGGREISGKPNHEVYISGIGWTRLRDIVPSDAVQLSSWITLTLWRLLGRLCSTAERIGFKHAVMGAAITSAARFGRMRDRRILPCTETSTSPCMAPSPKGMTSITTTITASTTSRTTLSPSLTVATNLSTCRNGSEIQSIDSKIRLNSTPLGTGLGNGIGLQRGLSGIESMPSSRSVSRRQPASSADQQLLPHRATSGSVPRRASSDPSTAIAATSRWSGLARIVAWCISRIGTSRGNRVLGVARHTSEKPTPVYDLTLERHNAYWANGILVSNCADAVVMAWWTDLDMARRQQMGKTRPVPQPQSTLTRNNRVVHGGQTAGRHGVMVGGRGR